jgi:hypothetical protein
LKDRLKNSARLFDLNNSMSWNFLYILNFLLLFLEQSAY